MSANKPFGAEMGAGTSSTVYGVVISSRGSLDFENVVGAEDELELDDELDDEELDDDELDEELDDICRFLAEVMYGTVLEQSLLDPLGVPHHLWMGGLELA